MNALLDQQRVAQIERILGTYRGDARQTLRRVQAVILNDRLEALVRRLLAQHGPIVQSGPFAGMKYPPRFAGSMPLPKLLGSYESELHGVLREIATQTWASVINIGCGEGYYAVGLARLLPAFRIHAFDSNPKAQDFLP